MLGALALGACEIETGAPRPRPVPAPSEAREVVGQVLNERGEPLAAARVSVLAFHAEQPPLETETDESGTFTFTGLVDANALLSVSAAGYYGEIIPVFLQGQAPLVELQPLALVARQPGRVRLWFAGDTMFGRRFEDKDGDGRLGEAGELIRPGGRADDAYKLFEFLLPALESADYRVANFESPASTAHASRHPYKSFSFTSHPDTVEALRRAGIDAVSLGNNHSYDYLEVGRIQTEGALAQHRVAFFGSGPSESAARESLLDVQVNDVPISFQGFCALRPVTFYPDPDQPWEAEYLYVAMDEPRKGGALFLDRANLTDFLRRNPERLRIPVMHGGVEYTHQPIDTMRDRFEQAHAEGAKLVVAHHSHTVQGVALWGPPEDPSLSLLSLGNFIFDQDVIETFNSYMAIVDVDADADAALGYRLRQVRLIPFHQEDYVPSLLAGRQAQRLARHVGHISTYLPDRAEDGLRGAVAFADAAGIGVMLRPGDYREERLDVERRVRLASGESAIFALDADRGAAADYFAGYQTSQSGARLRLARDLLVFGDFEDYDVDAAVAENVHWSQTENRFPTRDAAHSGRVSMALYRSFGSEQAVLTQLRNRITFPPGAELGFGCFFKGEQAGDVTVEVRYVERDASTEIAREVVGSWREGSYDWTQRFFALHPPAAAGHVRLTILMQPSELGGTLFIDDCTLLEWGPTLEPGQSVAAPHGYDWARLSAPGVDGEVTLLEQRRVFRRAYAP